MVDLRLSRQTNAMALFLMLFNMLYRVVDTLVSFYKLFKFAACSWYIRKIVLRNAFKPVFRDHVTSRSISWMFCQLVALKARIIKCSYFIVRVVFVYQRSFRVFQNKEKGDKLPSHKVSSAEISIRLNLKEQS